jgi:hypothetical protein
MCLDGLLRLGFVSERVRMAVDCEVAAARQSLPSASHVDYEGIEGWETALAAPVVESFHEGVHEVGVAARMKLLRCGQAGSLEHP